MTSGEAAERRVTVCVCTRDRPDELAQCLASIRASRLPIFQTVVSDDSTDQRTAQMLQHGYEWVTYVEGPRRGLGPNRNRASSAATGDYVLFLDDDACLGETFVEQAFETLEAAGARASRMIVSGCETNRGRLVRALDQSFLGYQSVPYRPGEDLRTIVINSTLFPRKLFAAVEFDDNVIFGCDEVDIAARAIAAGYVIVHAEEAVNHHFPSAINRDAYRPHVAASRMYVTFRRYAVYERNYVKAAGFAVIAPLHCLAAAVKRRGLGGVADAWSTLAVAGRSLMRARAASMHDRRPMASSG